MKTRGVILGVRREKFSHSIGGRDATRRGIGSASVGGLCVDIKYINPFLEGVDSVFTTMLELQPKRDGVKVGKSDGVENELTTLVGISGEIHGVVVMRFPPKTALDLAGRMLGSNMEDVNADVVDAIAEIVNMVAGAAKAKFECDPPLQLGLPTVVQGSDYKVQYPTKSVWLNVPFSCEAGKFCMEVTFSEN